MKAKCKACPNFVISRKDHSKFQVRDHLCIVHGEVYKKEKAACLLEEAKLQFRGKMPEVVG